MTRADRIFSEFIFQCRPRVSELAQVSGARVAAVSDHGNIPRGSEEYSEQVKATMRDRIDRAGREMSSVCTNLNAPVDSPCFRPRLLPALDFWWAERRTVKRAEIKAYFKLRQEDCLGQVG
jgi:hypothetical protein